MVVGEVKIKIDVEKCKEMMARALDNYEKEKENILKEFLPVLKEMPHKLTVMQMLLSQLASWFFI